MCGEKSASVSAIPSRAGSPPRVRGEGLLLLGDAVVVGITPACAGRRNEADRTSERIRDHPRVCGEKLTSSSSSSHTSGSPPRVRGEGDGTSHRGLLLRITPACAGRRFFF